MRGIDSFTGSAKTDRVSVNCVNSFRLVQVVPLRESILVAQLLILKYNGWLVFL
jgi:hypothetical protein